MAGADPGVRAVVLDLDDVLLDFRRLDLRATRAALGDRGASFTDRDHRALAGVPDPELFRILRILFNLDAETVDLVAEKERQLLALIEREARPAPEVLETTQRLRGAGYGFALASASSRKVIDAALDVSGLAGACQVVVSGDEVERARPDGLLLAAYRLGVPPGGCRAGLPDA
jgi:beta-phosphoglucomutase-like phosphatase (HAD superfamily)